MKTINNKGFSMVELIIVMAIMAVLVGILAPQYIKYLDKTKCTADCSAISTVLDACQTIAMDPDVSWNSGDEITIEIGGSATTYSGGACSELEEYVPASSVQLKSTDWGPFEIKATKVGTDGVIFDIANDAQITQLGKYSEALSKRLE